MPIPINGIGKRRLINQIEQNLTGLQRDMHNNAVAHRAMALAESPNLATLAAFVADSAAQYLRRLQWVLDVRNDPVRRQRVLDLLATVGWTEDEITGYVQELRQAAIALRDAPRTSYAEIVTACDAMLVAVDLPESLWPE